MSNASITEPAPRIYRYEVDLGERPLAGYVLSGRRPLVVDSGVASTPETAILPLLERLDHDPATSLFLISHADADHFGGNAALRAHAPDAPIACHVADRELVENRDVLIEARYRQFESDHGIGYGDETIQALREMVGPPEPVDLAVVGGESVCVDEGLTAEILHTPGHTAGHLTLWLPKQRVAIVQDAVLDAGVRTHDGALIQPPPYLDLGWYRNSIETLLSLQPECLLTAHFPVLRGREASAFLERSLAWTERFDEALREAVRETAGRFTAGELVPMLDTRLGPYPMACDFVYSITAHLALWERNGAVVRGWREGVIEWVLT